MRLWIVCIVLLVPAAGAVPVDLYMHLNSFQDMPINTQEPHGEAWTRRGMAGHSDCLPEMGFSMSSRSLHTWYAYGSPGPVGYDVGDDGPRIHQERGLGTDLRIDPELSPVLTWHLVATGPFDGAETLATVVPDVVVRVQVRASDEISVAHEAFDAGPLVAFGEVGRVTLHEGMDHPSVTRHDIGDRVVYAFEVPLVLHNTTIARDDGYNIRIDVMMDNPHCKESAQGGYLMPDLVTAYQGHGLWNQLRLGVANPLVMDYMHLQLIGDDLVVHASASSPFGMYDVAVATGLVVSGPADLPSELVAPMPRYHEHSHGIERAYEPTWVVNVTAAPHGLYTVLLTMTNAQETAKLTATATFEIGDAGMRICHAEGFGQRCVVHRADFVEVPALPLLWLAPLLLALRRR